MKDKANQRTREIPPSFIEMAKSAFKENLVMNAAKKSYEGLRKTLLAGLDQKQIKAFRTEGTDLENKPVTIDVLVDTPWGDVISVKKLIGISFPTIRTAVDALSVEDQKRFYGMLSATKKSVTEQAGGIVVTQSTVAVQGTRNVFLKAAK